LFEHIPCIITPQDNTNMIKEVTDDEIMWVVWGFE
jgi:hypothetical protein